jgi:hypothetical protein
MKVTSPLLAARAPLTPPNQVDRGLPHFGWTDGKAMYVVPAGKPEELRIGLDDAVGRVHHAVLFLPPFLAR